MHGYLSCGARVAVGNESVPEHIREICVLFVNAKSVLATSEQTLSVRLRKTQVDEQSPTTDLVNENVLVES
jgi:hypothetical protein